MLRVVCAACGVLLVGVGSVAAQETSRSKEVIEQVVRELLEREPEIVIDAIRSYQAAQEEARDARVAEAIAANRAALESDTHPSIGPRDAAVTVVEFFDYRCGFCQRMVPRLDALLEAEDDVRVVFIEFPVLGPDSLRAAQASLAVWRQSPQDYEAFHHALMEADDLSAPALVAIAEALGLDGDRLVDDMQSEHVRGQLMRNHALAQEIGVEGTPAFIIGDTFMPGAVPLEELEQAVAQARS